MLLRTVPGLSTALGGLLAVMLTIKAAQGIGGMFSAANANATGLTRTTTGLVGSFRGLNEQIRLQQWHAEQAGVSSAVWAAPSRSCNPTCRGCSPRFPPSTP
ncbi:hypothetical protein ACFQ0M_48080 [Kitasatospora aburaviensis]